MATNTSRVKLRRPQKGVSGDPNDPINVLLDWNAALDEIDDGVGMPDYTSTTHSNDPFEGKIEFETDTGLYAIWDAFKNDWITFPGESQAKGFMGEVFRTSFAPLLAVADNEVLQPLTLTWTAEAGRRYWVEFIAYVIPTAGTPPFAVVPRIRGAVGASVTIAGSQLGGDYNLNMTHGLSKTEHTHRLYEWLPGVNGQVTVGLTLQVANGGATARAQLHGDAEHVNWLMVRDVGI
jgi:hypothetical protein